MGTVLGIWAHPDDEVFVSGGLMADAVRRGDRVACLHMTKGEGGLYFRDHCAPETLASIRQRELKSSLARLGVTEQRFLDYPDGGLIYVPREELTARIYETLVDVRPHVIVTFGADGYTGHPDHKSLSACVTGAVRLWNRRRVRVLHAAVPSSWETSIVPRLNEFDFFWPDHPARYDGCNINMRLAGDVLDAKVEAIYEHSSQMKPLFDAYGEEFMRQMASTEAFRIGPRTAFRSRVLRDLRAA